MIAILSPLAVFVLLSTFRQPGQPEGQIATQNQASEAPAMDNVEKVALTMVAAIICAALLVGTALVLNGALLLRGPR